MSTINSKTHDGHVEVLASLTRPGDVFIRSIGKGPIPVSADSLRRAIDIEAPQESWDDADDEQEDGRASRAEQGWAEANDRNARQAEMLAEAECHDCIRDAAVITDEAIGRFRTHMWEAHDVDLDPADAVDAITAALTPPPSREAQEAAKIEALIAEFDEYAESEACEGLTQNDFARFLAERGVRVTTEED